MPVTQYSLPTGSHPGRFGHDGAVRLINCQAERLGVAGKIPFPIYAVAGLKSFGTVGNGPCRALFPFGATMYDVSGREVFPVDITGTAGTALTGGFEGDALVDMARNQKTTPQIGLVADGVQKVIEGGVLSPITDTDLPPANSLTVIDGYGIFGLDNGRFHISSQNDMTAFDPLDFATAEANPDNLGRVFRRGRELQLFGDETTEAWTNTGAAAFPFERLSAQPMELGILARHSAGRMSELGAVAWLANDGTVRLADGYTPVRISNHAVERSIAAETNKAAIEAFVYADRGHTYYVLSGDTFTWVFDYTLSRSVGAENAWHERVSQTETRWRASRYARFNGKNIVGDFEDGKLYEIDADTYDENGVDMTMTLQFPIESYPNRIRVNWLYVDVIPGVGLNASDVDQSDPEMMLRLSDDGAKTWGNEQTLSLGQIGEPNTRVPFRISRIFDGDGVIAQLRVSAPVIRGISDLAVDVDVLRA